MSQPKTQRTAARDNFNTNVRRLKRFFAFFKAEFAAIRGDIDKLAKSRSISKAKKVRQRLRAFRANTNFFMEWHLAMLVTFTETYFQDVLAHCASIDPSLMNESSQTATYPDVLLAGSLDELAHELRLRWARNFIDRTGPNGWLQRLTRMGARAYAPGLGQTLEELWGVRHMIVHRAGRATGEFSRRHPTLAAKAGRRVRLTDARSVRYTAAVASFVASTDGYFLKRYSAARAGGGATTTRDRIPRSGDERKRHPRESRLEGE